MSAYTMKDAEAAQERAADAAAYSHAATRQSKACREQATELHRRSDEARRSLTNEELRGPVVQTN